MGKGISPVVIVLAAAVLVSVVLVVRARRLRVEYSVLWILGALAALAAALFYPLVKAVAPVLGVIYTPSAIFFLAIFFLVLVTLHLSVKVSRLENDRVRLTQKVALLEARLGGAGGEEAEARAAGPRPKRKARAA